ncbi:MAG: hypothetical protein ABI723_15040 [Bacteroidia bacterium]
MNQTGYIPGACNIGSVEVRWRKVSFYIALAVAAALFVYNLLMPLNYINLCILFFTATITAINFQQYRNRFCIKYGWLHQFNFGKRGMRQNVYDKKQIDLDRKKVIEIVFKSFLFAVLIVVSVYLLHS